MDTLGLLWGRQVTKASCSEQAGFWMVFISLLAFLSTVLVFFADRGYRGLPKTVAAATGGHTVLELAGGISGQKGFSVQAKRWIHACVNAIVERTFAWLNWSRRLSKDYEVTTKSSEAWIDVSAIRTTLRKLQPN